MKEHFIKLYKFNDWANTKILELVLSNADFPQKALKYFEHILIAEKTWMVRIKGEEIPSNDFWYDISRNDLQSLLNENTANYLDLINNPPAGGYETKITYKNSKGIEYSTSVEDILIQISMHGSYHRGQINAVVRNAGLKPVPIDYITYTRL
jgi:uncharacterized damage-inducible protein DinB